MKSLERIVDMIEKDEKIHRYLKRIDLTSQELIDSYKKIMESLQELYLKAKDKDIMKHSIGKTWTLLEDFISTKDTKKLDSK